MRLPSSPDSGGPHDGLPGGDSVTLRSLGNTPLGSTDGLVAQSRWGTPPEHVPGVRFATRKPAAVIQTVVYCVLQNRSAGFRIRRVVGKHIGKATSWVRQSFQWLTPHRPLKSNPETRQLFLKFTGNLQINLINKLWTSIPFYILR